MDKLGEFEDVFTHFTIGAGQGDTSASVAGAVWGLAGRWGAGGALGWGRPGQAGPRLLALPLPMGEPYQLQKK